MAPTTPDRWREVKAVVEQALGHDPVERAAFLDEVCRTDPALRQEVESLLQADPDARGLLEPPATATLTDIQSSAPGPELIERLRAALGAAYVIERELHGGGMGRVFVAQEKALGREVVVKVLPPGLAMELNAERFQREIRLAARLQHPHVVPVHSTGQAHGLVYYTMPFVKGESLKQQLEREGPPPLGEAVRLLREVADALGYAHRLGIIHRDLKPANILLEERHALVTDFGLAKALVTATGDVAQSAHLTLTGLVLGTPAYMAPEQAAGDQSTDHRADLYALGCLAYELLTGQPPFAGPSARALIGAHLTQAPEPLIHRRPEVPRELNQLVMRLLAKLPSDRPQSAEEVLRELEALSMPPRRVPLLGILGIYGACAVLVLGIAHLTMVQLGLPDWVMPGAGVLLLIGLPIILATALLQVGHVAKPGGGPRPTDSPPRHWLTWRRAISGGVLAFSGLGVVVTTYMGMRAFGIGPLGTLLAAGVFKEREPILLADFDNRTQDSLLGNLVTEAVRIDLAQSSRVSLVPSDRVAEALELMQRPAAARLNAALAREVARREGIRAVVTGTIASAGPKIVLSTELISAQTGQALAADRESADSSELLAAVDRLSGKIRERIGESLKSLRAEPPLARVTTGSLQALRKYTQAIRAENVDGNTEKAIALGEEAVAIDTGFAAAYGLLGGLLFQQYEQERAVRALTNAFHHRARLTERERYVIMGSYYDVVTHQPEKAIAAYRALLDINPEDVIALHNLGTMYLLLRQYTRAEEVFHRAVVASPGDWQGYVNLTWAQVALGKRREAEATVGRADTRFPHNPWIDRLVISLASSGGNHEAAEARARTLQENHGESLFWRRDASELLGLLAAVRGRLSEAQRHLRDAAVASSEEGDIRQYLLGAISIGLLDISFRHQPGRGLHAVETALKRYPLDSLAPLDRPYADLAAFFARAGRQQPAHSFLEEYERTVPALLRREVEPLRRGALGELALADGRPREAVAEFRQQASSGDCSVCGLYGLGRAFDQMQEPDSAIGAYERYVTTPYLERIESDAFELAPSHKRLGELYEARGNREKAVYHYTRFVELWKDCDPELRPQVAAVRHRLVKLSGGPRT
ncbi:MAG TPA: protein kinase [Gemmatimonadales bacterium]|nr:protein kinase [Gemmatimonadales bacterium]